MKVFELMDVLCTGQRVLILELGGKTHFLDSDSRYTKEHTPLGNKNVIRVRIECDEWGSVVKVFI